MKSFKPFKRFVLFIWLPLCALLSLTSSFGEAATRHVSPSGGGDACTETRPCALSRAHSNARKGDQIVFAKGEYKGFDTVKDGIEYVGAPNFGTVISGHDDTSGNQVIGLDRNVVGT